MTWTIRQNGENAWSVYDGSEPRAGIIRREIAGGRGWKIEVTFRGTGEFDWHEVHTDAMEARVMAFGYVRGIERATQVHARETRKKLSA